MLRPAQASSQGLGRRREAEAAEQPKPSGREAPWPACGSAFLPPAPAPPFEIRIIRTYSWWTEASSPPCKSPPSPVCSPVSSPQTPPSLASLLPPPSLPCLSGRIFPRPHSQHRRRSILFGGSTISPSPSSPSSTYARTPSSHRRHRRHRLRTHTIISTQQQPQQEKQQHHQHHHHPTVAILAHAAQAALLQCRWPLCLNGP